MRNMKYILKKKWHPSQVEEVGHVFEEDEEFSFAYGFQEINTIFLSPHEIALLCDAGYLKKENTLDNYADIINTAVAKLYKQKKPEVDIDKILHDTQLDLWTEEPPGGTRYWSLKYSDDLEEETVGWEWYTFSKISRLFHLYNLHTKNCHKTQKSAEEALKRLMSE